MYILAVSPDEYKIRNHFTVIKGRVEKEVHVFPSVIFVEEIRNLQKAPFNVYLKAIAEHVKPYKCYKSTFEAIRKLNKTKIPTDFDNLEFINEYAKFTETLDKKEFLQYDNNNKSNRIQIFASKVGMELLSASKRWQGDGTFFCAPKPFKQVYYLMGEKPGEKLLPCLYICMKKRTYKSYVEVFDQLNQV